MTDLFSQSKWLRLLGRGLCGVSEGERSYKEINRISFPGVGRNGSGRGIVIETSLILLLCKVAITRGNSELHAPY